MTDKIIYNQIDFNKIELRKFQMKKLTKNHKKNIFGLDTETLDGNVKLISDSDKRFLLNPKNADELLNYLTHHKYRSNICFFYNIGYDSNAIIKSFPIENIRDLYQFGKTDYKEYEIFIIPRKLLRIHKNKSTYCFYDLFQFYEMSLEKSAKKYLNLEKYINPINTKILGQSLKYWNDNLNEIIEYCINDSILCQKLGVILQNTLSETIGIYPDSYISKAGLTKQYIRKSCDIPNIHKIPINALKFAFDSYSGGRFEIIKKGYVGECSLFDIVSAYPFNIKNLLDVTNGVWKRVSNLHENSDYGFYLVKLHVKYNKITPIQYQLPNGIICYPVFESGIFLTKQELLKYEKFIDYDIITGWEFYSTKRKYPFKEYIDMVFNQKSITPKTDYKYNLYKILMNSLYGCFYEKIKTKNDENILAGKLFNPIYATLITANTRIQLFDLAKNHINDVIGFATDSILFKGKPDIKTNKILGDWDFETNGETVVLRSGIYQINDKIKSRGIQKKGKIITPVECSYNNLFDYIKNEPEKTIYPITINRPLTFIECLQHHKKHDISDINRFVDMDYRIDINTDYKRLWNDVFNNGGELFVKEIDSSPLILA